MNKYLFESFSRLAFSSLRVYSLLQAQHIAFQTRSTEPTAINWLKFPKAAANHSPTAHVGRISYSSSIQSFSNPIQPPTHTSTMFKCLPILKGCQRYVEIIERRHAGLVAVPDEAYRSSRTLEELILDANQIKDLPVVRYAHFLPRCPALFLSFLYSPAPCSPPWRDDDD